MRPVSSLVAPLALILASLPACAGRCGGDTEEALAGRWRAVLEGPGGEVPFGLTIERTPAGLQAALHNAGERLPLQAVTIKDRRVSIEIEAYDASLDLELAEDGTLEGEWVKVVPSGAASLPLRAVKSDAPRFPPVAEHDAAQEDAAARIPDVSGTWTARFESRAEPFDAVLELVQSGSAVTGNVMTPAGDFGLLEGSYQRGVLRLSRFDGANAILIHARADTLGTLTAKSWISAEAQHRWIATRTSSAAREVQRFTELDSGSNVPQLAFRLPDLEGKPVSLDDPRFKGKVVIADVFGSWCVTCVDQAPVLARWYRRYRERGLEMVGLAFEYSGDPGRDREVVRAYGKRHGLEFPLLIGGSTGSEESTIGLDIEAYPTTFFIGRDGKTRSMHRGFVGPQTGVHHQRLVAEMEALIEQLLAETSTTGASR